MYCLTDKIGRTRIDIWNQSLAIQLSLGKIQSQIPKEAPATWKKKTLSRTRLKGGETPADGQLVKEEERGNQLEVQCPSSR